MKTYLKILPYMGIAIGLLGLLVLLSFSTINSCEMANSKVGSVMELTQTALGASSLKMAKYHALEALGHLEGTMANLDDCGCGPALAKAKDVEGNLKRAMRAKSLEGSKGFLKLALKNTLITMDALENFDTTHKSTYGDDVLVMNTKEVLKEQGGVLLSPAKQIKLKMDQSLSEFKTSLGAIIQHVNCEDAFNFINKIIAKSNRSLYHNTLTEAQREYHTRVKAIAYDTLLKLEGCPTQ